MVRSWHVHDFSDQSCHGGAAGFLPRQRRRHLDLGEVANEVKKPGQEVRVLFLDDVVQRCLAIQRMLTATDTLQFRKLYRRFTFNSLVININAIYFSVSVTLVFTI